MAKTAATKKPRKTVTAEPEQAAAAQEPPELTPREHIEKGLAYLTETQERFDLSLYALQDGAPEFFKTLSDLDRHKHGRAIKDYVEKTKFALASLVDEVKIVLGVPVAAKANVSLAIDTSLPAPAAAQVAGLKDMRVGREKLALVLTTFAQHEVMVANGKKYFDAGEYLQNMVAQLDLQIAQAEQAA